MRPERRRLLERVAAVPSLPARYVASRGLVAVGLAFFLVFTLFPFYWMVVSSFKATSELYSLKSNPFLIHHFTLSHYIFLFTQADLLRWTLNSVIVAFVSCGGSLLVSILAGYSLARLRYRGAATIGWGIFVTYLVPPTLLFIPMTVIMSGLGLINSLWSLILSYPTFLIPFSTWLLMGYFRGIPYELEEAALVDGCTRLEAMLRIAVPLAVPGVISAGVFAFTLSWNEYLYALTFISSTGLKTLPYGVPSELIKEDTFFWGSVMGAALLASVPVAALYSVFASRIASGITAGAVKG